MQPFPVKNLLRGLVGALIGGTIGFFIFQYLYEQGFYSLIIPGALVGIGFELAARKRHIGFGVLCAFLGLASCLISEWRAFNPFDSFPVFLSKFKDEGTTSFVMLGIGVAMAFWFGWGRERNTKSDNSGGAFKNSERHSSDNPYQTPSESDDATV